MKSLAVAALIPLAGCVQAPGAGGSSVPPNGFANDLPDTAELALLQHALKQHFAGEFGQRVTTCAGISEGGERALPEPVEAALMERVPDLAPFGRCTWDENRVRVVDTITGQQAAIVSVLEFACDSADDCIGLVGHVAGNMGANYTEYRVRRTAGGWTFEPTGVRVMS